MRAEVREVFEDESLSQRCLGIVGDLHRKKADQSRSIRLPGLHMEMRGLKTKSQRCGSPLW